MPSKLEGALPLTWYKEHVLRGAIEHQLPKSIITVIEMSKAVEDEDYERATRERAIYYC